MADTDNPPKRTRDPHLIAAIFSTLALVLAMFAVYLAWSRAAPSGAGLSKAPTRPADLDAETREQIDAYMQQLADHHTAGPLAGFSTIASILLGGMSILLALTAVLVGYARWQYGKEHENVLQETRAARDCAKADAENVAKTLNEARQKVEESKQLIKDARSVLDDMEKEREARTSYESGLANVADGENGDAISDFKRVIEQEPHHAEAHLHLAETQIMDGRRTDAVTSINKASKRRKNGPRVFDERGRLGAAYLRALAEILDGKETTDAETKTNERLKRGVRLTNWSFDPMDAYLGKARARQFKTGALTRAKALHNRVKKASQKK